MSWNAKESSELLLSAPVLPHCPLPLTRNESVGTIRQSAFPCLLPFISWSLPIHFLHHPSIHPSVFARSFISIRPSTTNLSLCKHIFKSSTGILFHWTVCFHFVCWSSLHEMIVVVAMIANVLCFRDPLSSSVMLRSRQRWVFCVLLSIVYVSCVVCKLFVWEWVCEYVHCMSVRVDYEVCA